MVVHMHHPDIEAPATASEKAFRDTYAKKGWQLLPEPEVVAGDVLGRFVRSVSKDVSADEAKALAMARRADPGTTKDSALKAYLASFGDEAAEGGEGGKPPAPRQTPGKTTAPKTENQE